jgi:hypothetical protein
MPKLLVIKSHDGGSPARRFRRKAVVSAVTTARRTVRLNNGVVTMILSSRPPVVHKTV